MRQISPQEHALRTYLIESSKTLSGKFYYDNSDTEPDVYHYATQAIKACNDLDLVKKKKFYNKEVNITSSVPSNLNFLKEDSGENTLHAAIGLTTECGEILDAVIKHKYSGAELDVVNIKEEIGDLMWYMAILLRDHNIDLFDAMETNIKKLRQRYGEKFSTDKANNRNLEDERTILETNRQLENGGMAPPKAWVSVNDWKIEHDEKDNLVSQMRTMSQKGQTITKSNYHHKQSLTIEEFTKPFSYLENTKDYNGSFIVNVLNSELEINTQATNFKIDFSKELLACKNCDMVIISIFDIVGSVEKGEAKKFLLGLDFNKFDGTLSIQRLLYPEEPLSARQIQECEKFCKIKNIKFS